MSPPPLPPIDVTECPYRGLVPYTEKDAEFFFGRREDSEIIVANALTTRLTLFYGSSGVGKSSVLHAGVLRELKTRAARNLSERNCAECIGVYFASWRDEPVAALIARVGAALRETLPPDWRLPPPGKSLVESLRTWSEFAQSDLILILDQFEEYFLYRDIHDVSFERELASFVSESGLRVNFLISLREDALARLDAFKATVPGLFDNCLRLEHLTVRAAREAIEGPLQLYNERHVGEGRQVDIEPALADAVLDQVQAGRLQARQSGVGEVQGKKTRMEKVRVEAPYLQMVLTRLWREDAPRGTGTLRLATLDTQLGGAANIVRTHLDLAMSRLTSEQQAVAARVFRHLVTPSGTKIAHFISDLGAFSEADTAVINALFDRLDDAENRVLRDVTPPGRERDKRYEIYHDLLAAPVLDWRHRYEIEQRRKAESARAGRLSRRWAMVCLVVLGSIFFLVFRKASKDVASREAAVGTRQRAVEGELTRLSKEEENLEFAAQVKAQIALNQKTDPGLSANDFIQQLALQRTAPNATPAPSSSRDAPVVRKSIALHANNPHRGAVWNARHSAEGLNSVVTAGRDHTARVAHLRKDLDYVLTGHTAEVNVAIFNPAADTPDYGGWIIATASDDQTARLWRSPQTSFVLMGHRDALSGVVWSRDGKWLATTSKDRTAKIWSVNEYGATEARSLAAHTDTVWAPALAETPQGGWLVTPSSDGTARVWSFPGGLPGPTLEHGDKVWTAAIDPAARWVATGGRDGRVAVWSRTNGKMLFEFKHSKDVRDVAFHLSEPLLATASSDGTAMVWNVETQKRVAILAGHTGAVWSVSFVPQGGTGLVTASWDRTARLWDYGSGRCVAVLEGHTGVIWSVSVAPTGRNFVTTGGDGAALLWQMKNTPGAERFGLIK